MADPDIAHADIAGWVLGALDPDESERFQAHLEICDECQREVAELSPSATLLGLLRRVWTWSPAPSCPPTCRPGR